MAKARKSPRQAKGKAGRKQSRQTTSARENAGAKNNRGAGKRSTAQPKAAGGSASSKPAPAKRQPATPKKTAAEKKTQERQGLIRLFIAWLRAVLSYKKGERSEFRYNYDENHPGYVFREENGKLKSFGVTHSDTTFGVKNMPLEENPDSTDEEPAYIRSGVITTKKKRTGGRMKNLKLSSKDKAKIKSKKRNYKKVAKQQKSKNRKSK